jgi:hypothetical protein
VVFKLVRKTVVVGGAFAAGAASSWVLTRRMRSVTDRYMPAELRDRWRGNVSAAVTEGRDAMRAREAELKRTPGSTSPQ